MTKKKVLVRDVDDNIWNWFVGYCKQKGKKVGDVIENMILEIRKGKNNH